MTEYEDRPGADNAEAIEKPSSGAHPHDTPVGYAGSVWSYRDAGWLGAMPLPPGKKFPPPTRFTGHNGAWPDDDQINTWSESEPDDSNLGLRMPYGVIGIDVDAYDTKTGSDTLAEAEKQWGPLPPTYRSSSRPNDNVSGIRFYRVPEDELFCTVIKFGDLGIGDIELIQPHHRYAVVWPSTHPATMGRYRWYDQDGSSMPEGEVPRVDDLPDLPWPWVEALRKDVRDEVFDGSAPNRTMAARQNIDEGRYRDLVALTDTGVPDKVVRIRLDQAISELVGGTNRFETTRDHVAALMRLHAVGRTGVLQSFNELCQAYVIEVSDSRPSALALREFVRFTEGAAALIAAVALPGLGGGNTDPADGGNKFEDQYLDADQLHTLPAPELLIEGVLSRHAYVILRGRDASFKSFIALDWALSLATGKPWQGTATEQIRVLYVAGEGAYGLADRKRAWEEARGVQIDPGWFTVRQSAVNLFRPGPEFDDLLRVVEEGRYGLVIFDTLRRMSTGANENTSDMGVVVDNLDKVKQVTANGSVLAIAHTDKGDNDSRGFSGTEDDADIVWSAKRTKGGSEVTLSCHKMKDGPDGHHFDLSLAPAAGSLVIEPRSLTTGLGTKDGMDSEKVVMAAMEAVFSEAGATASELVKETGRSKTTVYNAMKTLESMGLVTKVKKGKGSKYFLMTAHTNV